MKFAEFLEEMGIEDYTALYPHEKLILAESYILVAEDKLPKTYEMHYALEDNGDGSCSLRIFPSAEEMDRIVETYEEDFIEPGDTEKFTIEEGRLTPKAGFYEYYE